MVIATAAAASMAATAAARKGASVKTLEGERIKLSIVGGKLTLNGSATVSKADIGASNGVVHLINTVLVPPSRSTAELSVSRVEPDAAQPATNTETE